MLSTPQPQPAALTLNMQDVYSFPSHVSHVSMQFTYPSDDGLYVGNISEQISDANVFRNEQRFLPLVGVYNSLFDMSGNLAVEAQTLRDSKLFTPVFTDGEFRGDRKELAELIRIEWKKHICLHASFIVQLLFPLYRCRPMGSDMWPNTY